MAGRRIEAFEKGTVEVKCEQADGSYRTGTLFDALNVPELAYNLLSIAKTTSFNKTVRFDHLTCQILDKDEVIGTAIKVGNLYYLKCHMNHEAVNVNTVKPSKTSVWHHRYGHLNLNSLRKLANESMVKGFKEGDLSDDMDLFCVNHASKEKFIVSPSQVREADELNYIYSCFSDICGKINSKSLKGGEYFLTFVDDHTR